MFHADFECYMEKGQLERGLGQIIKYPGVQHKWDLTLFTAEASRDRPEGFKQESDMTECSIKF